MQQSVAFYLSDDLSVTENGMSAAATCSHGAAAVYLFPCSGVSNMPLGPKTTCGMLIKQDAACILETVAFVTDTSWICLRNVSAGVTTAA